MDRQRIARFISRDCTEEERAQIQAWICARSSRARLVAALRDVWELPLPRRGSEFITF